MAWLSACIALAGVVLPLHAEQELDIRTNYKEISRYVEFDHIETGFALTGYHKHLDCIKCHESGQNEKLPHRCDTCHNNELATGMPKNHVATREPCDICHTTSGFIEQIDMDHRNTAAPCIFCHDGFSQSGKSVTHIQSSNNCKICHNTQHWRPLGFVEHHEISVGACDICHNNVITQGKDPAKHISTSNQCEACHNRSGSNWHAAQVDHEQVLGSCSSCHNNLLASGPNASHISVNLECDACHNAMSWQGLQFSHAQNPGMRCVSCHDSIALSGKPLNHVKSSDECENCHDVDVSWRVIKQFDHTEIAGPCRQCHQLPNAHIASLDACDICHQTVAWSLVYVRHLSLQATACQACHNNSYADGKSPEHCPSSDECRECHSVNNWQSLKSCRITPNDGHNRHHLLNQ